MTSTRNRPVGRRGVEARAERGAGSVLTAAAAAFMIVTACFAVLVAAQLQAVHAARAAADLAAIDGARSLAAGHEGCSAAATTAQANGGELISCREVSDDVEFVIAVKVAVPISLPIPGLPTEAVGRAEAGRTAE